MRHNWILDVLTDLKTFAAINGLPALAEQLEDTQLVASAELGDLNEGHFIGPNIKDRRYGSSSRGARARGRA